MKKYNDGYLFHKVKKMLRRISYFISIVNSSRFAVQCKGNVLGDQSGIIQSPEYPKNYPPFADCEWSIAVEKGYSIVLNFEDVSVLMLEYEVFHWISSIWYTKAKI